MAEIEVPNPTPPPKSGSRDDSAGTLFKIAGSCCVTICGCIFGLVLLLMSITIPLYVGGLLLLFAIFCIILGCYSAKYSWDSINKASG